MNTNKRKELFKDVLTTAVQGGISYWCAAKDIEQDESGKVVSIIKPFCIEDEKEKWKNITLKTVENGFKLIINGDVKIRSDLFNQVAANWADIDEPCDIDAADCIIQAGLFKEIIYG